MDRTPRGRTRVGQYQKKYSPTREEEQKEFTQTTRSTAWELIPFTVL